MTLSVQGKRAAEPFDVARYTFSKYNEEGEHRRDRDWHKGIV